MSELRKRDEAVLKAIGSTEETTFKEFCAALGENCPQNTPEWSAMFNQIRGLEEQGMIEVHRLNGKTEGFILTEQGANAIRDKLDAERGLLRNA